MSRQIIVKKEIILKERCRPNPHCHPGRSAAEIRGPEPRAKAFQVGPGPRIRSGAANWVGNSAGRTGERRRLILPIPPPLQRGRSGGGAVASGTAPPSTSLRSATSPSEEGEGQGGGGPVLFAEVSPGFFCEKPHGGLCRAGLKNNSFFPIIFLEMGEPAPYIGSVNARNAPAAAGRRPPKKSKRRNRRRTVRDRSAFPVFRPAAGVERRSRPAGNL